MQYEFTPLCLGHVARGLYVPHETLSSTLYGDVTHLFSLSFFGYDTPRSIQNFPSYATAQHRAFNNDDLIRSKKSDGQKATTVSEDQQLICDAPPSYANTRSRSVSNNTRNRADTVSLAPTYISLAPTYHTSDHPTIAIQTRFRSKTTSFRRRFGAEAADLEKMEAEKHHMKEETPEQVRRRKIEHLGENMKPLDGGFAAAEAKGEMLTIKQYNNCARARNILFETKK